MLSSSLTNLFNALPRRSPLRLKVYTTLLTLASSADELNILLLTPSDVEKWLSEWDMSSEEKIAFLKQLVEAYEKAGDPCVYLTSPLLPCTHVCLCILESRRTKQ